jgi:Undecaprenyl-phosphate galactose phosphotransferase WbaP
MLALADAVCMMLCWAFALWAYRASGLGHYKFGAEFYLGLWPAVAAFVFINGISRLYHGNVLYPAAPISPVEELRRLAGSAAITHLGVIAYLALAYQTTENYSRAVIVISGFLTGALSQTARDIVRALAHKAGVLQIPVVVAGPGSAAKRVADTLSADGYTGLRPVAVFDGDCREIVPESRRLGVRILVSCQDDRIFKLQMPEFSSWFIHVEYLPSADSFPVYGAHTFVFDGLCGLEMVNQRRMAALRVEKWLLDKTLAVIAFAALSPFFVVVPLLVKLTSAGPVFYRQARLGRNGRKIRVWKFRSMYADAEARLEKMLSSDPAVKAEWEANFKLKNDPRVTPLGRFLRKTSIDEFPQLFNVFSGDMALVGPRPIVEAEVPLYGKAYPTFSSVEPGITGLWQASGRSGTDYARRIALDTYYVLNWSPWLDIWIMKKTVGAVLFMRGAQ